MPSIGPISAPPASPGILRPSDLGALAWTFDPALALGSGAALTPAGYMFVEALRVETPISVTNIVMAVSVAGNTLTTGQCKAALYQGNTATAALVGVTAEQHTAWASAGLQVMPLVGGPFVVQPGPVMVGVWYNGTTGPSFFSTYPYVGSASDLLNIGSGTLRSAYVVANGLTTTAANPLGPLGQSAIPTWWVALT